MKTRIICILTIAMLIIGCSFSLSTNQEAHAAEPLVNCRVVVGQNTRVVCTAAGVVVLDTAVNVPTVTLPPVIQVGPTRTATVTIPGPTKTVGTTSTQTITVAPTAGPTALPTRTVTVRSTQTVAAQGQSSQPRPTRTITATTAGQDVTSYVTVSPTPSQAYVPQEDENDLSIPLPDGKVLKAAVGIGYFIGFMILAILLMWYGYYRGYKNSDKRNTTFLKLLSDKLLLTRKR